jgi:predicted DNA-binding antitoxin AbrB/MazE fold protein
MDLDSIDKIVMKDGEAIKTVIISKTELIEAQNNIQGNISAMEQRLKEMSEEVNKQIDYYTLKLNKINQLLKEAK